MQFMIYTVKNETPSDCPFLVTQQTPSKFLTYTSLCTMMSMRR